MNTCSLAEWNEFVGRRPEAHLLQHGAWGELKADFGWSPARFLANGSGAQVLFRRLPLGLTIAYLPRGPVGPWNLELWKAVRAECLRRRAIFLKLEPDGWDGPGDLPPARWTRSDSIQPPRTVVVDLSGGEEDWLARMKQKTRYNIRLAEKKGVTVGPSSDLAAFHAMMQVTGARDGFGVHSLRYYQRAYDLFYPSGGCELLMAEYAGQPLAGLMVFASGARSWYVYGASTNAERSRMPTYLLQWAAMRWAAARGCVEYDLWGVPDCPEEELEANFETRSDALWGVYRFKRGFGGALLRSPDSLDTVFSPILYQAYRLYRRRGAAE